MFVISLLYACHEDDLFSWSPLRLQESVLLRCYVLEVRVIIDYCIFLGRINGKKLTFFLVVVWYGILIAILTVIGELRI